MKITSIKSFPVDPGFRGRTWLFVKIETDAGLHGWGEVYTLRGRDQGIAALVGELGAATVGRSPFDIKHFTQVVHDDYAQRRASFELYCAQSALEHAMWDIVGKACGQPVYNLLGGACRGKLRVYANGWSDDCKVPADYARAAEKTVARGYSAIKLSPLPNPWRTYVPRAHEDHVVAVIKAVRDAVGPDVEILFDALRRLAPASAIRLGQALEPYKLHWYEEPCAAENFDALADVRDAVSIPIVSGETLYGKSAFRGLLERRAVDIINPDVCNVGGILEMKEIAAMAEPYSVAVSPHNFNSTTVALAATVHAGATMPNFTLTEYYLPFADFADQICPGQLRPVNGYIELPETPGLGVDLDESVLARYAGYAQGALPLRSPAQEP
ncbi:MAG TPA: mandelate racemase/muconate lactonizing enzyme family protein [Bordetella sp.]|nr:mandelate racemase/muconate lactonizing enzyme family protein [Bordetella sp.]